MTTALVRFERTRAVAFEGGELRVALENRVGARYRLRRLSAVAPRGVPASEELRRDPEEIV